MSERDLSGFGIIYYNILHVPLQLQRIILCRQCVMVLNGT